MSICYCKVVPVSAGRSRLFIASPIQLPLPVFLLHALSMRFIDSDLWVADQERVVRGVDSPEPGSPLYVIVTLIYICYVRSMAANM